LKIRLHIVISTVFLLSLSTLHAQQLNLSLNQEYSSYYDQSFNDPSIPLHTGFKPMIESETSKYKASDSAVNTIGYYNKQGKKSWFYRKFYDESLFILHDTVKKFWATIDPLFNFQFGDDKGDSARKVSQNTRGFIIQGGIGPKFSFSSSFFEDQATFPYYVDSYIQNYKVIPGQGRVKLINSTLGGSFYSNGYDFSVSESYLSFSPSSHFNIQLGQGKNFIGDGYRSLLLSDNSFDYPYLRVTSTFGRFQYTNLYCLLMNTTEAILAIGTEGLFQRKAANFQYLSWSATNRLEIGIFQALIWKASDTNNRQCYNLNYFDPIIGVSAARYGLADDDHNVLLGSTIKYKITNNILAYGQVVIDDMGPSQSIKNKTGYQLGLKYYNHLGELLLEYNQVRPYTYTDDNYAENYTNYNQALGDPLGANFKEFIAQVNFRFAKHFAVHLQANYALIGGDAPSANNGGNIFLSDTSGTKNMTSVKMGQGLKGTLNYMDGHISYLMNPKTNMNVVLGVTYRGFKEENYGPGINAYINSPTTALFYIGFRTSITNSYFDF
jgi:hypothetical protein